MRIGVQVQSRLRTRAVRDHVYARMGGLVRAIVLTSEARAKYFAPYDTGFLESEIAAEQIGPLTWNLWSRAPYALIQEIRQPYLYSGVLDALHQADSIARLYTV